MDVYLCGPSSRTAALWSLQLSGRCRCISNICEMEWEVYLQRHSRVGLLFWIYWLLKTQDMIYVIYLLCYIWRSVLSAHISYSHLHPEVYLILLQTYNNCIRRRKMTSSLHYSALSLDLQCIYASMTSFHAGSIMSHFASHIPVASSQKPSRSRSFCGGALRRGDEGLPYAFRRLLPHPRLFRVLTPVMGLVPLAYLHNAYKNSVRN